MKKEKRDIVYLLVSALILTPIGGVIKDWAVIKSHQFSLKSFLTAAFSMFSYSISMPIWLLLLLLCSGVGMIIIYRKLNTGIEYNEKKPNANEQILIRDTTIYLSNCLKHTAYKVGTMSDLKITPTDEIIRVMNECRNNNGISKPSAEVTDYMKTLNMIDANGNFIEQIKPVVIKMIESWRPGMF